MEPVINNSTKRLGGLVLVLIILLGGIDLAQGHLPTASSLFQAQTTTVQNQPVKLVTEESATINIVKNVGPSVVTVTETTSPQSQSVSPFDLGPFSIFGQQPQQTPSQQNQPISIGSGFIVSSDGLIVTNKHVVSDVGGTYRVTTADDKTYDVKNIYRDPLNDIAIIKIDPAQNSGKTLKPVTLGDSSKIEVGEYACAIGTALGEFRNSVTTGVVSGLGRGIQAGDAYAGYAEDLNNVIQTSAAINPGNSGGPLINSSGQVIGVNTAVAQNGQNIGFALPINTVKDSLSNFNQTGQFNRPYLGVKYTMLTKNVALSNNVPQGAYIQDVVSGSPADQAGLQQGDIITKADGQAVSTSNELSTIVSKKKVGDSLSLTYWRNGSSHDVSITLGQAPNQ